MCLVPSFIRDLCWGLIFALFQPRELLDCGWLLWFFDQESHPTLEVNFPLGPLPELRTFLQNLDK